MGGTLVVAERLTIDAHVLFRLELAGGNPGIELVVNGSLTLDPIGGVDPHRLRASGSTRRVSSPGSRSALDAELRRRHRPRALASTRSCRHQHDRPRADARVEHRQPRLPAPHRRLRRLPRPRDADRASSRSASRRPGFQLLFGVAFDIGGLQFRADGGAAVVGGSDPGFVLFLNITAKADTPIFLIEASGSLQLNTTNGEPPRRRPRVPARPQRQGLDPEGHQLRRLDARRRGQRPVVVQRRGVDGLLRPRHRSAARSTSTRRAASTSRSAAGWCSAPRTTASSASSASR